MANPKGVFDSNASPAGWFSSEGQAGGWFDEILLDAASAVSAGIIALVCGYMDHALSTEILESYTPQILEAQAPEAPVETYVIGESDDSQGVDEGHTEQLPWAVVADAGGDYIAQVWTDPPEDQPQDAYASLLISVAQPEVAPDTTEIPPPVLTDPVDEDPLQEAEIRYQIEDDALALSVDMPDEVEIEALPESELGLVFDGPAIPEDLPAELFQAVITDLEPDDPVAVYASLLLTNAAPEVVEEVPAVLTVDMPDSQEDDEQLESFAVGVFEDDGLPLTVEMPEEDEPEPYPDAAYAFLFEDAPPPDLTFVPGWQDDYLRAYEQEALDREEFELVGMVFNPYGQVDDPPPYVPPESCFIPPFRRRRR